MTWSRSSKNEAKTEFPRLPGSAWDDSPGLAAEDPGSRPYLGASIPSFYILKPTFQRENETKVGKKRERKVGREN